MFQSFFILNLYKYVFEYRIFDLGNGIQTLFLGFFLYSFFQYFTHFISHKIRIFWCLHEVHHSSTQLNGTAGIRNSIFDLISTEILYLFIPFLGVPPIVYLIIYSISKAWGSFIHINEKTVSNIPILNKFIVDPAIHQVHHAQNLIYLDKNYSEVTPIYDKLFGTFQPKTEPIIYGASNHPPNLGFWDTHLFEFRNLKNDIKSVDLWKHKLLYLIKPPGWSPEGNNNTVKQKQRENIQSYFS